jgi:hypothetical protein
MPLYIVRSIATSNLTEVSLISDCEWREVLEVRVRLDAGQGCPAKARSSDADLKTHVQDTITLSACTSACSERHLGLYRHPPHDEITHALMPRPPEHPRHAPQPSCPPPDPLGGPQRASIYCRPPRRRANIPSQYRMTGATGRAPLAGAISHVAGPQPAQYTRSAECLIAASRTAWAP